MEAPPEATWVGGEGVVDSSVPTSACRRQLRFFFTLSEVWRGILRRWEWVSALSFESNELLTLTKITSFPEKCIIVGFSQPAGSTDSVTDVWCFVSIPDRSSCDLRWKRGIVNFTLVVELDLFVHMRRRVYSHTLQRGRGTNSPRCRNALCLKRWQVMQWVCSEREEGWFRCPRW